MDMYTLLYLKQVTNKDLLHSTWNSAQCYVPGLDGSLGENGYVYMAESPPCSHEAITTLLIGYTPIQNKKFKIKTVQVYKCFFF